jgi:hypothetical protein
LVNPNASRRGRQAAAEGGDNDRLGGGAGELRFEPAFEFSDERRSFGLADRAARR